jgi:WD40 repeat protein
MVFLPIINSIITCCNPSLLHNWWEDTINLSLPELAQPELRKPLNSPQKKLLARILSAHSIVAITPNGQTVAAVTNNHQITLWTLKTGEEIKTLAGHNLPILAIAISPNGKYLASAGHDKIIKVWNLQTGNLVYTLVGHTAWIEAIAFSPNGQTLVSAGGDKTIKVWQLETGIRDTLIGHADSIYSVAISHNGDMLATGSWDVIKLWNLKTGREIRSLANSNFGTNSLVFSLDGQSLISGSGDNKINIWDLNTSSQRTLSGHKAGVSSLILSPDGQKLISGSLDNTIKIWNLNTGEELRSFPPQSSIVESIALSPDGQTLISGGWGNIIKWNFNTGEEMSILRTPTS